MCYHPVHGETLDSSVTITAYDSVDIVDGTTPQWSAVASVPLAAVAPPPSWEKERQATREVVSDYKTYKLGDVIKTMFSDSINW